MKQHSKAGRSAYGAASVRAMEVFVSPRQRLFEDAISLALLPSITGFLLRRAPIRAACTAFFEIVAPGIRGALLCPHYSAEPAASMNLSAMASGEGCPPS
jgi:hypothetical protein